MTFRGGYGQLGSLDERTQMSTRRMPVRETQGPLRRAW